MTSAAAIRVLVFSPRFPPANAADAHRVRLLVNHLQSSGLHVVVLSADPSSLPNEKDPWQLQLVSKDLRLVYVPVGNNLLGWRSLFLRSFLPFWSAGAALIRAEKIDVVFFSSTEFPLAFLLPVWKRLFGVACVMDFQDPWVNDYYRKNPSVRPPGGRVKYFLASLLNRVLEPFVYRALSAVMAVSRQYLLDLADRYDDGKALIPSLVCGFPAEPAEYDHLDAQKVQPVRADRPVWRYVGRGGGDMLLSVGAFFSAWSTAQHNPLTTSVAAIKLEMIGTSYASAERALPSFDLLAEQHGLVDCFTELPLRIPYSETLLKLKSSSALIVFGSDDPAYTASKIYPYLLAGRPLLAIFHERSSVVDLIQRVGGAVLITFNGKTTEAELSSAIHSAWFANRQFEHVVPLDMEAFAPYTARYQANQLISLFEQALVFERTGGRAVARP